MSLTFWSGGERGARGTRGKRKTRGRLCERADGEEEVRRPEGLAERVSDATIAPTWGSPLGTAEYCPAEVDSFRQRSTVFARDRQQLLTVFDSPKWGAPSGCPSGVADHIIGYVFFWI